jgi:hypothetical protein
MVPTSVDKSILGMVESLHHDIPRSYDVSGEVRSHVITFGLKDMAYTYLTQACGVLAVKSGSIILGTSWSSSVT